MRFAMNKNVIIGVAIIVILLAVSIITLLLQGPG